MDSVGVGSTMETNEPGWGSGGTVYEVTQSLSILTGWSECLAGASTPEQSPDGSGEPAVCVQGETTGKGTGSVKPPSVLLLSVPTAGRWSHNLFHPQRPEVTCT